MREDVENESLYILLHLYKLHQKDVKMMIIKVNYKNKHYDLELKKKRSCKPLCYS